MVIFSNKKTVLIIRPDLLSGRVRQKTKLIYKLFWQLNIRWSKCYVYIKTLYSAKGTEMAAYVPVIVWIVSAMVCHYIAQARNVKPNLLRRLIVVCLGPLAIPLVFIAKPENSTGKN